MTYTLYAASISLFSGKARAYLNWKSINFREVSPTSEVMKSKLLPSIGWAVIPVLETPDGTFVQDTADIIQHIEDHSDGQSVMPEGPVQRFVTELLHCYADQWLTLPAMHYRWNHNETWILEQFGKNAAPDADLETQLAIGAKRGAMFKGMVPMLGITSETADAIETSYEAFLDEFSAHLEIHDFVFGGRPSLADFALYGPLYAHLYRDPASGEIMKTRAPLVARWVERLRDKDYGDGKLLGDDKVPETLLPLLTRHNIEHLPVLSATNALLDVYTGSELPRALGMVPFTIGETQSQTLARPFSLFRLNRALEIYANLDTKARELADSYLDATHGFSLKNFKLAKEMKRENFKLIIS